jgi:ABC-type antimicrobial peptide transport system permease subunit
VGVTEDVLFGDVSQPASPHVFLPRSQWSGGATLLVKAQGDAAAIAPLVRQVLEEVEPGTEIGTVATLEAHVARATAQPRFTSRLVLVFGGLALALASVGIYGTLAYLVGSRTRELGVRIALGASRRRVLADVLRRGLVPAAVGTALGLGIAAALARTFASLLFGVAPMDAVSFAGGTAVLLGVALLAALGPARRAAAIDPVQALRAE